MPIEINEIVVSVQVTGNQGSTQSPPTNADLQKQIKKSVDEVMAALKAKKER